MTELAIVFAAAPPPPFITALVDVLSTSHNNHVRMPQGTKNIRVGH